MSILCRGPSYKKNNNQEYNREDKGSSGCHISVDFFYHVGTRLSVMYRQ